MEIIIIALVLGIGAGMSGKVPAALFTRLDRLMTVTLFVMLVALGAQIGGNSELLASLPVLGWRALVITVLAIAGSVATLWLTARWFKLGATKGEHC